MPVIIRCFSACSLRFHCGLSVAGTYLPSARLSSVYPSIDDSLADYAAAGATYQMGYSSNHYNYQIAVIFAILIGAVLLLLLVLVGIWFITKSMRGEDEEKKRFQSGRNSAQWPSQAPSYQPPSHHQNQSFDFPITRSPAQVAPSPVMQPAYNQPSPFNQQYSQVPLVTPVNQEIITQTRTTQLQPDVIYTQGPVGFVRSTPAEYTFHQSSV